MALNPADIATASRLLDEALELPPAEREAWLAALPAEHQHLAPALRDMLAAEADLTRDDPLASLPHLDPADESVALAGQRIGPYRLLHEIGHGGMGSVWLAERADGAYKRQLALKLPRLAWGAGLARRMERERDIGALLEHPNIARLYDAGVDERGRPYLALEYIDGQPIDAWCEAQGLSVRARLGLFVQVARAVAYAHGRLVVHRDLKPSNVLVSADGQVHLLDFGIAKLLDEAADEKLTQQQGRVMTPHYASPEQVAGEPITVQSDIYSLGVLLYELLTATLPIAPRRSTLGAVEEAILQGDAPPASSRVKDRATAKALRGEVDAMLAKAMQREPARRYATADAMALDIERHLKGETVAARPDTLVYRWRKTLRRHRVAFATVTVVLVAVVTGSGVAVVQAQRATRAAERERIVKAFVFDVFRMGSKPDAKNTALRPATTRALIEEGAQLIQQRFAGQPDLQAELFGVVGGIFSDMGAYNLAADYAGRQVESLMVMKAEREEQARALLNLAQALIRDGRFADAEPRLRRVAEQAGEETPLGAEGRVLLSHALLELGRPDESLALLDAVDARLDARGASNSLTKAKALYVRGRQLSRLNRSDESFEALERSLNMAISIEGRLSTTAIDARLAIAYRRAATLHDDLARAAFGEAAMALRELGGAHEVRLIMETATFAWHRVNGDLGTTADAEASIAASQSALDALQTPTPPWFRLQLEYFRGFFSSARGDFAIGLPLLESSVPILLAKTQSDLEQRRLSLTLGFALMATGRHRDADVWLRKTLDQTRRAGRSNHPQAAFLFGTVATNLRMMGDFAAAAAILDSTPRFEAVTGEGGADPLRYAKMVEWQRARLLIDQNHVEAALSKLRASALSGYEYDPVDARDYEEVLGIVLCRVGRGVQGMTHLKKAMGLAEQSEEVPYSPARAALSANIGLCALATGDSKLAKASAKQARAAFTIQPGVSPYYKAPLFKLEQALGLRLPPV